ncbi:hypothetical protein KBZ18_08865 [Synechococcus sp. Cruz-9H2]|uniref:LLM class flavin-dependent oxidoreductase n=1 Tax=unclassified Synechococcus TaxID=2626047 RepID=UPI0020CDC489|nr:MULTISPECIES: LLM class flavin-dependent oxidoreductase [unclassified Synechococcus]MCP9819603.1 hypothetical protein [Synechococcus sp. Cruz-9H2]MCP9843907.1 hypothetical protein [Synechococcus sp. Edmonson 11F2]MCP9855735.1 hypothetical protein [Synechococcus sp. Cruz-9C9]MCP9863317.1 hypothetical protein [Synechococcus sp. Cruz-7E5]MCP9870370.1 hypothetical protein [Synechococcus sp. Cruz-7B9]
MPAIQGQRWASKLAIQQFNRREGIMQSNSSVVLQFIEKVLNRGEVDAAGEFFWEDMVEQVPLPGQGPGV